MPSRRTLIIKDQAVELIFKQKKFTGFHMVRGFGGDISEQTIITLDSC